MRFVLSCFCVFLVCPLFVLCSGFYCIHIFKSCSTCIFYELNDFFQMIMYQRVPRNFLLVLIYCFEYANSQQSSSYPAKVILSLFQRPCSTIISGFFLRLEVDAYKNMNDIVSENVFDTFGFQKMPS